MDRFQEMQAFAAVVDAGSFVGAAQALGMSKPAVSRYVSELEARLGARLLQRTTRKLSLTGEGEVFYGRCKVVLADVDSAEAEVASRTAQATGTLKVNVPVSYGLLKLAPLWGPFLASHPNVQLDVTLADRFVDLVEEGYDLAVRIARLPSSTLVSRKLASTRLLLCASPQYLRERGSPRHPSELTRHAMLAYSLLATGTTWSFEGPEGPVSVKVEPRMWSNSGDTCRAVALSAGGIILQPSFMVGDDLRAGTLVEVLPQYRSSELGIYAVYPTRKHLTPKVRLLVDYLAQSPLSAKAA
jgi:DNA-binding transcriptional LysR family regulator